tara:strand:+ start:602 stop:826 length:225 start_codon:yes stop_codon:yes gene_type:complete
VECLPTWTSLIKESKAPGTVVFYIFIILITPLPWHPSLSPLLSITDWFPREKRRGKERRPKEANGRGVIIKKKK